MVGNISLEIVFVGKTPFPVSSAASNRILTIAKGLVNAGASVTVYDLGLTSFSTMEKPINKQGTIHGISWHYTSLRVSAFKIRILNGLFLFIGQLLGYPIIVKKHRNKKPAYVTSQTGFLYIFPLWLISKVFGGKLFFLRSEFPIHVIKKKWYSCIIERIVYPVSFKCFDGQFIMTNRLKIYFEKWIPNNSSSVLLPLTLDLSFYNQKFDKPFNFEYIAYCGSLSNQKDGIDILISSFKRLYQLYPNVNLVIIGGGHKLYELKDQVISELMDANRLIFTGLINFELVPKYLVNAKILALARPSSLQAEGGFPTKLGEYLATGNPVVVTNTGEISSYLTNMYNAVIAEPGNIDDFTEKLKWLLDHPENAKAIGLNGKKIAEDFFDMNKAGKIILKNIIGENN